MKLKYIQYNWNKYNTSKPHAYTFKFHAWIQNTQTTFAGALAGLEFYHLNTVVSGLASLGHTFKLSICSQSRRRQILFFLSAH